MSAPGAPPLQDYLRARRGEVERALEQVLPPRAGSLATIQEAMRYSLLAGGNTRASACSTSSRRDRR